METINDFFNMKGEAVYKVLRAISTILLVLSIISVFASIVGMAVANRSEELIADICFIASLSSCVSSLFMFGFCYVIYILKTYVEPKENVRNAD